MASSRIMKKQDSYIQKNEFTMREHVQAAKESAIKLIQDHDFDSSIGSGAAYISNNVILPPEYFVSRQGVARTAEELAEAYNAFNEICNEANKYTVFAPTINTFCAFCCITTNTLKEIANERNERGKVATMILERLSDRLMQNIMSGKIQTIGGIFVAKANFGMRDNENTNINIVNVQNTPTSVDDILKEFTENTKK